MGIGYVVEYIASQNSCVRARLIQTQLVKGILYVWYRRVLPRNCCNSWCFSSYLQTLFWVMTLCSIFSRCICRNIYLLFFLASHVNAIRIEYSFNNIFGYRPGQRSHVKNTPPTFPAKTCSLPKDIIDVRFLVDLRTLPLEPESMDLEQWSQGRQDVSNK